jgi:hypothetical protein
VLAVEHNCKLSELTSALRSKLGQSNIRANEELLIGLHKENVDSWNWLRDADMRMTDELLRKDDCLRIERYAFKWVSALLLVLCRHELLPCSGGGGGGGGQRHVHDR